MALPNPSMSFTPFDILTAEEMNDLVENITALWNGTAFNSNSIDADFLLNSSVEGTKLDYSVAGGVMWQQLARVDLSVTGATMATPTFTAKKYLMVICLWIASGGNNAANTRFNGDTGNNYAFRYTLNNGTETPSVNGNTMASGSVANGGIGLSIMHIVNIAAQEKLTYYNETLRSTAGAGTPPERYEIAGKWANTTNAITQITRFASSNNFGAGSMLIVLGKD